MIDAYVRTLRTALGDRLPPSVTLARLREAEGHLRQSAAEVGEAEAVRRYGAPRWIANELVRQARGYANASGWRLAWGVGVALLFSLVLPYGWLDLAGKRDPNGVEAAITAVRWVPFLALLLFAARAYGTRRWLVAPSLPFVALAASAIMTVSALVPSPPPSTENFAGQRTMIAFWKEMEADVRSWRGGGVPIERVPVFSGDSFVASTNLPLTPFEVTTERRTGLGVEKSLDLQRAKRLWDQNGEAWSARVGAELREAQATYGAMLHPGDAPPIRTTLVHHVVLGLEMTLQTAFALMLANALTLAFGGLMDRRPVRRS